MKQWFSRIVFQRGNEAGKRTPDTKPSSSRRSSTTTDTWPGGVASRSRTRSALPSGKSKSGFKTDGWNGRRRTSRRARPARATGTPRSRRRRRRRVERSPRSGTSKEVSSLSGSLIPCFQHYLLPHTHTHTHIRPDIHLRKERRIESPKNCPYTHIHIHIYLPHSYSNDAYFLSC